MFHIVLTRGWEQQNDPILGFTFISFGDGVIQISTPIPIVKIQGVYLFFFSP